MNGLSSWPHSSAAILVENSSDKAKKILVRKVCSKVRQLSPGKLERNELMLCVATMEMHLACRERLKNFSSPRGSFSPTVAKVWYSSQRKKTGRKCCPGLRSILGMRCKTARSKSIFIMVPMALARPAFMEMGRFKAQTLPFSMSQLKDGRGFPYLNRPCASCVFN